MAIKDINIKKEIMDILEDFEGERADEPVFISSVAYTQAMGRIMKLIERVCDER